MTPSSTSDLVLLDDTPSPEWHSGICISDGSVKDPTIADIDARRQAVGQMVAPTAAYADSDMFKLQCSRVSQSSQHPLHVLCLTGTCVVIGNYQTSGKKMGQ